MWKWPGSKLLLRQKTLRKRQCRLLPPPPNHLCGTCSSCFLSAIGGLWSLRASSLPCGHRSPAPPRPAPGLGVYTKLRQALGAKVRVLGRMAKVRELREAFVEEQPSPQLPSEIADECCAQLLGKGLLVYPEDSPYQVVEGAAGAAGSGEKGGDSGLQVGVKSGECSVGPGCGAEAES